MKWRKELWGIKFSVASNDTRPMLIGFAWHDMNRSRLYYLAEPTRALLFQTRKAARTWCNLKNQQNKGRTDCCWKWRFTPIRVIE